MMGRIAHTQRRLALVLMMWAASAPGETQPRIPPCQETTIRGQVAQGEHFERALTADLVFRLDPESHPRNPQGWTIRVTAPIDSGSDFAMVATPPYRFSNPRYVNTAYGISADAALAWTPREFAFVADAAAYETAMAALEFLLWPGNYSSAQVAEARADLLAVPTYSASFQIEDGAARPSSVGTPLGEIEWMRFRAELCVPEATVRE